MFICYLVLDLKMYSLQTNDVVQGGNTIHTAIHTLSNVLLTNQIAKFHHKARYRQQMQKCACY